MHIYTANTLNSHRNVISLLIKCVWSCGEMFRLLFYELIAQLHDLTTVIQDLLDSLEWWDSLTDRSDWMSSLTDWLTLLLHWNDWLTGWTDWLTCRTDWLIDWLPIRTHRQRTDWQSVLTNSLDWLSVWNDWHSGMTDSQPWWRSGRTEWLTVMIDGLSGLSDNLDWHLYLAPLSHWYSACFLSPERENPSNRVGWLRIHKFAFRCVHQSW